ncbi:hypothetical protein H7B90_06575 [Cohnella xylanilytica]|uniref:Class 3 adenylate cyclase n=1 Tax=Cohnella xylanilytica TaxID=557555 RepID=A0A841TSB8_9BACL|nr:hypothetical protein [Cohnella xylanilytica]MBB6691065.1 hypothetical protein [Cohnella xylanilytica]
MQNEIQQFEYYFVAFIDLLGFSAMVKSDLESISNGEKYINKLYKIHQQTTKLNETGLQLQLVQFSDSIVLATKYDKQNFNDFLNKIGKYQYDLFSEGILSRGGIAFGKHFYRDGFMFSLGLIEAYNIETSLARYPRIIISNDLLDIVTTGTDILTELPIIRENDGLCFVDYFRFSNAERIDTDREFITTNINSKNPSIREKYIWLAEYLNFKHPTITPLTTRFKTV